MNVPHSLLGGKRSVKLLLLPTSPITTAQRISLGLAPPAVAPGDATGVGPEDRTGALEEAKKP